MELALRNPGAVVIPLALTAASGINGHMDDIVDVPSTEVKGTWPSVRRAWRLVEASLLLSLPKRTFCLLGPNNRPFLTYVFSLAAPTELMSRGQLAMKFQLDTKRETVEAVGQKYAEDSQSAAWFTNAPTELPNLASKDQLTLIRQFAASRSLSMVVKSGTAPTLSIPPSQLLLKPKSTASAQPVISSRLASTSLSSIPARSSQLLADPTANRKSNLVLRPSLLTTSQSLSSPDISATISTSSSRKLNFSEYADDDDTKSIDSDDAFNDDLIPDRSGSSTPPLPTLASEVFSRRLPTEALQSGDLDDAW